MLDDSGCMVGIPETMPLGQLAEPGHAPTQEASPLVEGKVVARAPTSATICCAESAPNRALITYSNYKATHYAADLVVLHSPYTVSIPML